MTLNSGDYKAHRLLATIVICTCLSTLSFLGRIWGRSLSAKKLGWDDLLMTFAILGCWSVSAINIVGLHFGAGHHSASLPPSDIKNYVITLFVFIILQDITTALIKIAIIILYKRTFTTRAFHIAVWVVGATVIVNGVAVFISLLNYCTPIARFWDPLGVPGHCVNIPLATTLNSLTILITDIIIYIMPMPIIWRLKMTTKRKIETTLIFIVGLFICLSRVVQLVDTIRIDFNDPTWSNVDPAIWNLIESHIGAVAANIPLMGPLINVLGKRLRSIASTSPARNSRAHSQWISKDARGSLGNVQHGFKKINDDGSSVGIQVAVEPPTVQGGASKADDELHEMRWLGKQGIRVRTDLEQNYGSLIPTREVLV